MTPEFSRPITADRIGPKEMVIDISAEPAERAALARRLAIPAVDSLSARLRLRRVGGGLIRLRGALTADVVQSCVVSLEPVPQHVEETFQLMYGESAAPKLAELDLDAEAEDPPEPIEHGMIDLGEAVAEHLALALDPFPRRPEAVFDPGPQAEEVVEEPRKVNPFAQLAGLRQNRE